MADPKVCFISYNIPPDYSGAGKRAWKQAKYLAAQGMEVIFITVSDNREIVTNLKLLRIRMPINYMEDSVKGVMIRQGYNPVLFVRMLWLLLKHRVKLIHSLPAFSWLSFNAVLAGKVLGIKSITETTLEGADDPVAIKKSNLGWIKVYMFRIAAVVVNISPLLDERCREAGIPGHKLRLIPNNIDTNKFSPPGPDEKIALREKLDLIDCDYIYIYVGIMRERKRIAELIEAFRISQEEVKNCSLLLVGPVNKDEENRQYYRHLRAQVDNKSLTEKVIFTGEVNNIEEWLKASDTFLFASRREGLPNAVIEAASCGLPVVAMNIPKIMDYIFDNESESGIITDNFEQFTAAMIRLARDRDYCERISVNARKRAEKKFSDRVVMDSYRELYQELLHKGEGK